MYTVLEIKPMPQRIKQEICPNSLDTYVTMFTIKATDIPSLDEANNWITNNIYQNIDTHWCIKTSDILKFSTFQFQHIFGENT